MHYLQLQYHLYYIQYFSCFASRKSKTSKFIGSTRKKGNDNGNNDHHHQFIGHDYSLRSREEYNSRKTERDTTGMKDNIRFKPLVSLCSQGLNNVMLLAGPARPLVTCWYNAPLWGALNNTTNEQTVFKVVVVVVVVLVASRSDEPSSAFNPTHADHH